MARRLLLFMPDLAATSSDALDALAAAREAAIAGRADEAAGALNRLLQQDPDRAAILINLAVIFRPEIGEAEPADPLQQPEIVASLCVPARGGARPGLAGIGRFLRATDSAAAAPAEAAMRAIAALAERRLPTEVPRILAQLAAVASERGDLARAAAVAAWGSRRFRDHLPLAVAAAAHAASLDRWEFVAETAQSIVERDATNRIAWGYLALAKIGAGDTEEASALFKKHGLPHSADFLAKLSLALWRLDPRWLEQTAPDRERLAAEGWSDHPVPGLPARPAKVLHKAEALLSVEQDAEALEVLDAHRTGGEAGVPCSEKPNAAQARYLFLRGYALFNLGRPLEAFLCFAAAINDEPTDQSILSGLGQAARLLGRPREAASYFREIKPVGPDNFDAFFYLGLCYDALGDRPEALRALTTGYREFFFDSLYICLRPMLERVGVAI